MHLVSHTSSKYWNIANTHLFDVHCIEYLLLLRLVWAWRRWEPAWRRRRRGRASRTDGTRADTLPVRRDEHNRLETQSTNDSNSCVTRSTHSSQSKDRRSIISVGLHDWLIHQHLIRVVEWLIWPRVNQPETACVRYAWRGVQEKKLAACEFLFQK